MLDAHGWSDLLPLLQVAHGLPLSLRERAGGEGSGSRLQATPNPHPPLRGTLSRREREKKHQAISEGEGKAEAKRAFDEAILERLVALNAERAAEEARGEVRWLRPEFQHPEIEAAPAQAEFEGRGIDSGTETSPDIAAVAVAKPQAWPADAIAQVRAVADALSASPAPLSVDDITARFKARGPWKKRVPALLEMLVALGRAQERNGRYRAVP